MTIAFHNQNQSNNHDDEEEEDVEAGVDDTLLSELSDDAVEDTEIEDPPLGVVGIVPPIEEVAEVEDDAEDELVSPLLPDEDEEEDMDYDSFDDEDEL